MRLTRKSLRDLHHNDGGEILAVTLMATTLLVLLMGSIGLVRVAQARTTVSQVAAAAAREASMARSADSARGRAIALMQDTIADQDVRCRRVGAEVDASAFNYRVGRPGLVHTSLSCQVPLSDLLVPGLPGSVQVSGTGSSPLDRYRGRP